MDELTVTQTRLHALEQELKEQERKLLDNGLRLSVQKDHLAAHAEVKNFELFDGPGWVVSDGRSSSMWRNYSEGLPSQWNNEADIQSRAAERLDLVGKIAIGIEVTPTAKIKEDKVRGAAANVEAADAEAEKAKISRPDIWIVGGKDTVPSQLPIGVGEVKQPETNPNRAVRTGGLRTLNKAGKEQPSVLLGQIYDYLIDASTVSGLRRSFGILTNYHEWRFCWLPNANQAAASKSLDEYVKLPSTPILPKRLVYTTRVYEHRERELMTVLIHQLHKMSRTPRNEDLQLLVTTRKYPCLEKYGWMWSILDKSNDKSIRQLSYELFNLDPAASFFLKTITLKTITAKRMIFKAPTDEADLEREYGIWKKWTLGAMFLTLDSRPVLARFNKWKVDRLLEEGKGEKLDNTENIFVTFQTADRWVIDSAADAPGVAGSDIQNEFEVIAAVKTTFEKLMPLGIARLAITRLLAEGYYLSNDDVLWCHIAVLPTPKKAKTWDVTPIVIGLANVKAAESSPF
ncbi:hypothetical protein BDZ88DRAFT_450589 [Geranomyces variabilis]|nr:hypothetical protein BDZ88DRAFT_450589 [Geranomyces variabilis]